MGRQRIALFDNIKGLLIILVVIGHVMYPIHNDNPVLSTIFDIIYLFHMPLFVFVSGLFAKGAYRDGHLNVNRMIGYLLLGVIYQALLLLINGSFRPQRLIAFPSAPWYLIGMVWWYATTPLLARLSAPVGITMSLAVALISGCFDLSNGLLALTRSLAFLPYFALGYYTTPDRVQHLARQRSLWIAVVAAVLIAVYRVVNAHAYDWFMPMLYGDTPYRDGALVGFGQRLVSMAVASIFSLAILRLVPKRHSWLTTLGSRTLQVYVLHRLIRAALTFHTPFYKLPILLDPLAGTIIVLALSACITALCALPVFSRPFNAFLRIRWLPERAEADKSRA